MFEKYVTLILQFVVGRIVREEIRMTGLKAVRAYVQGVGYARMGVMAVNALGAFTAMIVTGAALMIIGICALAGVSVLALAWVAFGVGLGLALLGTVVLLLAFSQRRWLQASHAYELMDAVAEPVPNISSVPKNMAHAFTGQPMEYAVRASIEPKVVPPDKRKRVVLKPQHA